MTNLTQPATCLFRREGDLWALGFAGDVVRMPDLKGLHDLARLVAEPGREFHALDLVGAPSAGGAVSAHGEDLSLQGHAGELLDERAKAEYRQRIADLREDADAAELLNDPERAARARAELDALTAGLAAAFGLGGRPRTAGDPAERARTAVAWRIRSALRKLDAAHPALAEHLRRSLRTGTYCSYRPEQVPNHDERKQQWPRSTQMESSSTTRRPGTAIRWSWFTGTGPTISTGSLSFRVSLTRSA